MPPWPIPPQSSLGSCLSAGGIGGTARDGYDGALSQGNWEVSSSSASQVAFRLRGGGLHMYVASGTVTIVSVDGRTEIRVDAYS